MSNQIVILLAALLWVAICISIVRFLHVATRLDDEKDAEQ